MAGSRFNKKLQAIKSRMMMDDVPVDPSRRKLFTLPPEETSQSLPVPQTSKPESPLTQLINKPTDRREFLKQAGQSAKSAVVRGILPELGKLVEVPVSPKRGLTTMHPILEDRLMFDTLKDSIRSSDLDILTMYNMLRENIPSDKLPKEITERQKKLLDDVTEDYESVDFDDELYDLFDEALKHLPDKNILSLMDELGLDASSGDIAELLRKNNFKPEQIKTFLDSNYPYYDEDVVDEVLEDLAKKKSE